MFTRWGDLVFKLRFAVLGIVSAALLALGGYGLGLGDHLSSSGWDDPTSESAEAARISDEAFGRDHNSDVIVLYTAPEGTTIEDPAFRDKIVESLNRLPREHPEQIAKINGAYWQTETGAASPQTFGSKDKKYTFASVAVVGDDDTTMVRNFRDVKDAFEIDGIDVQVAGLQPVAGTLNDTMAEDQKRMELLAIPAVGVLLFFVFGGLVAAALPLVVGGLTVIGAWGIVRFLTHFTEVNSFVSPVVSMIGLGLAIDYGLFIVSRFREERAEGYDTKAAVRRSVMTAGRTVVFSATMIIASLGGMLLFPQGFLKSVAYGAIATVSLAAITALTVLPAMLAILGKRVDALGLKRFRATKTAEEVENSLWGRTTRWVMRHPLKIAIPITIILLLLIIPVKNLAFGGINERYLPPDNATRLAQAEFDQIFPLRKSDPVQIIFVSTDTTAIGRVLKEVNQAPGLGSPFEIPTKSQTQPEVFRTNATLADSENADPTIEYLRAIDVPDSVTMLVGGQPTIQKDSIDALLRTLPLMIALVLFVTTLLMFLTFGSLVLPIKAALMSALGLGSTLGILTWIFVDGHGAGLLNFTPQPIMSPVLVLIIAIIYGLSVDYEVFLLSRMVEARSKGASTTEAVRVGTAHTGRIITAAALILLVVTGAFAFSDLVMMQYIAYGMVAALFIDATVLRMLLVPAVMKMLGDDCWWAPAWMKRMQEKIGLGEPLLDDERPGGDDVVDLVKTTPITDPVTMVMPAVSSSKLRKTPRRPRTVEEIESEAPTARIGGRHERPAKRASVKRGDSGSGERPGADRAGSAERPGSERAGAAGAPIRAGEMQRPGDPTRPGAPRRVEEPRRAGEPAQAGDPSRVGGSARPGEPLRAGDTARPGDPHRLGGSTPTGQPGDPGRSVGSEPVRPGASLRPDELMRPGGFGPGEPVRASDPGREGTAGSRDAGLADVGRAAAGSAVPGQAPLLDLSTGQSDPGTPRPHVIPPGPHDPSRPQARPTGRARVLPPRTVDQPTQPHSPADDHGPHRPEPVLGEAAPSGAGATRLGGGNGGTPDAPTPETPGPGTDGRNSIEDWMAELRSSRRRITAAEEPRAGDDGRTVSVNELLRRRDGE
ncbi:MMPL family transporter [Nocardia asteroides]|uniref:MMPL family transporter n=1 Tax=Nocardia asteroides TaxID=1824 RepID=UPI001E30FE07|nr:MMPL family transporter [Nocardia asteroides]UGT59095.1 MMPL family transporter [Nocardia asteroides]